MAAVKCAQITLDHMYAPAMLDTDSLQINTLVLVSLALIFSS